MINPLEKYGRKGYTGSEKIITWHKYTNLENKEENKMFNKLVTFFAGMAMILAFTLLILGLSVIIKGAVKELFAAEPTVISLHEERTAQKDTEDFKRLTRFTREGDITERQLAHKRKLEIETEKVKVLGLLNELSASQIQVNNVSSATAINSNKQRTDNKNEQTN